jgi:hypothetical protein
VIAIGPIEIMVVAISSFLEGFAQIVDRLRMSKPESGMIKKRHKHDPIGAKPG